MSYTGEQQVPVILKLSTLDRAYSFEEHLRDCGGDVVQALSLYAQRLKHDAKVLDRVVKMLESAEFVYGHDRDSPIGLDVPESVFHELEGAGLVLTKDGYAELYGELDDQDWFGSPKWD